MITAPPGFVPGGAAASAETVSRTRAVFDGFVGYSAVEELDAPDTPTIETLAEHLGVRASATLKNLLVKVDGEIVAVGVPGHREVDLGKLGEPLAPAGVELVTAEDFVGRDDLVRGNLGPQGLEKVRDLADPRVAPGTSWITGANKEGNHARNVVAGRDFEVDQHLDVVVVERGRPPPEVRHRTHPATAPSRSATSPSSAASTPTPSSSTSSASRASPSASRWARTASASPAPWPPSPSRPPTTRACAGPARSPRPTSTSSPRARPSRPSSPSTPRRQLNAAGLRVLVDDRPGVSPGVKFTDSELIGVPKILVAGRRSADGVLELKDRRTGEREELTVDEAIARLTADLA
ncbi:proline--tRNA ligase [Streptomyces badius]